MNALKLEQMDKIRELQLSVNKKVSWNSCLTYLLLCFFGQLMAILTIPTYLVDPSVETVRKYHVALEFLLVIIAFWQRKNWSINKGMTIFVIAFLPFIYIIWFQVAHYVSRPEPWVIFLVPKVHCIVLALIITGRFWLNFLMLLGLAIECIALWFYMDLPHSSAIVAREPVETIVYFTIGFGMLIYRVKTEKTIQEQSLRIAELAAFENMAKIFINVRDRFNTPLQVLKLSSYQLHKRFPNDSTILTLDQSVEKLAELNLLLKKTETLVLGNEEIILSDRELEEIVGRVSGNRIEIQ